MIAVVLRRIPTTAWLVWGLAAFFFFSEYFARVSPSVMVSELARDLTVNARQLGTLSAYFYLAYIAMQIPVGMLVDRFGVHFLLSINAFLCAFGCYTFASTSTLYLAEMSRFIIGFSAAFAFVSALKLASVWFSPSRFGLLAGLTQALGMLGAAVGEAPVAAMVHHLGWRATMSLMGSVFMALGVLIMLFVRNYPNHVEKADHHENHVSPLWSSLKVVLHNPQTWINGFYVGLLFAPSAAFAEFWGVSFLERVFDISREQAASMVGMIFVGWFIGGPIAGWLSDKIGRRKPIMYVSSVMGLLSLMFILYMPGLSIITGYILLFVYGLTNTGVAISYALAGEINPRKIAGTSIAFTNMASVAIGAALQPVIGQILDSMASGRLADHGIALFNAYQFRVAMISLPVCSLLSLIVAFKIKETYCKNID